MAYQRNGLSKNLENRLSNLKVCFLSSAGVINLSWLSLFKQGYDGLADIRNKNPLTAVKAVIINWQWLLSYGICDENRKQFFRTLARAEHNRASRDNNRKIVSSEVGQCNQVCCSLGSGVGIGGVQRGIL